MSNRKEQRQQLQQRIVIIDDQKKELQKQFNDENNAFEAANSWTLLQHELKQLEEEFYYLENQ